MNTPHRRNNMEQKEAIMNAINEMKTSIKAIPDYGEKMKSMEDAIAELQLAQQKSAFAPQGKQVNIEDVKSVIAYMKGETKTVGTVLQPTSGGYLAAPWFSDRVVAKLYDTSPMMDVAEVIQVDGNIAELPVETSAVSGSWVGEIQSRAASDWMLGMANIAVNEYIAKMPVSQVLLEDSNVASIESYLVNNAARSIGRAIGKAFVDGTGDKQPNGIFVESNLNASNRITASDSTYHTIETGDLLDAMAAVPSEALYNAKWLMSTTTFFQIAKNYQGETGVVIMPLADTIKPMLFGHEVVFMDAPDAGSAANTIAAVFGDIFNAYKIVMRKSLEMQRDPYSAADSGQVVMRYRTRVGGAVVQPDSLAYIKTA
jgi:HK97 family phage major capsid protein